MEDKFSWVQTHQEIVEYLKGKEDDQKSLIELLKSVGISPFNDKAEPGEHNIELEEIDPFTFFCYLYKYGGVRRLRNLQAIAEKLNIHRPSGDAGIPSANAQKVWMFPYKYMRTNDEISRLWLFFRKALNDEITDDDFADILTIRNIGKTKMTEALFYIKPLKYFPINGPSKPFLKEEMGIDPKFNTYSQYKEILNQINANVQVPFYEVSYDSWEWGKEKSNIQSESTEKLMGTMGANTSKEQKSRPAFQLNTIFHGPPGTGKTYTTILRAAEIVENRSINSHEEATRIFNSRLHDQIEFITFHQNYSYEDFIQGLRPDTENDSELTFERKDGIFKIMADRAMKNLTESKHPKLAKKPFKEVFQKFLDPLIEGETEEIEVKMRRVSYYITGITNKSIDFRKASGDSNHTLSINTLKKMYEAESVMEIQGLSTYYQPLLDTLLEMGKDPEGKKEPVQRKNYVLIIDEINRANISRVFGELITLIEPDKRSEGAHTLTTKLPSGENFTVPSNLYIIGTMNTADKSIALLDIALRRRFHFVPMYPIYSIQDKEVYDSDILEKINEQIIQSKGHDFQIGHSYFMDEDDDLKSRMNHKVIPLLMEYYMNDAEEVRKILINADLEIDSKTWPLTITGSRD